MTRQALNAVLFDVGGTLLRIQPSVGEVYAAVAAAHGFKADPDAVGRGFHSAWKRSLERSRARQYRTSDEIQRFEWFQIVRETFGSTIPPNAIRTLFEDLYERFVSADAWRLVPGIRETLAYLRSEGIRLGVLSNWDSRLERMLDELQLADLFDFVVVSHAVGFEKPHPEIFQEALRRAGTEPRQTLHVGDSFFADIEPAMKAGLRTLWVAAEADRRQQDYGGLGFDHFPSEPPVWQRIVCGVKLNPGSPPEPP